MYRGVATLGAFSFFFLLTRSMFLNRESSILRRKIFVDWEVIAFIVYG